MARPPAIETTSSILLTVNMRSVNLTDDQFLQLCSDNSDEFVFEMTANRELIIMSPSNPRTDHKNAEVTRQLGNWAKQDGTGVFFGSGPIFTLPNGARRVPDGAWIPNSRWNKFSEEEQSKLPVICPDFVIELRSPSDSVRYAREKMEEYMANGAQLGWLLDPIKNRAYIYRQGEAPERIDNPTVISGDPLLPGFKFDFREIL